jgi:hypothetical protein
MENIALRINYVTNIVHRYYFQTYTTSITKNYKIIVITDPGLP